MAKDKLKTENEKGSLDHMAELGKAALTIGVGAALLYRTGGRDLLSRRGITSKEFISEARDYIADRSIKSYTSISGARELYSKVISDSDSILNNTRKSIQDSPIKLRTDDSRSLGGVLTKYKNLQNNGGQKLLESMYNNSNVKIPMANKFISEYAKDDLHMQRNIQRFVVESFEHIKDTSKVLNIAKKHKVNLKQEDIVKMSQEILQKQKDTEAARKEFVRKNIAGAGGIIDSILEKIIDVNSLEKTFGAVGKQTGKQNFINTVLGDHAVTVGDILKNRDKFSGNKIHYKSKVNNRDIYKDLVNTLEEISSKLKTDKEKNAFNNIYFDANVLRKNKSGEYSFKDFSETVNKAIAYSGSTIPGKILKTRDIHEMSTVPKIKEILAGSIDPQLAALTNKEKGAAFITQNSHIKILDKMYRIEDKGLVYAKELDNLKLVSGRYGVQPRMIKEIFGDTDYRESNNAVKNFLDLGLDGSPNLLDKFKSRIRKFSNEDWTGNVLNALKKDSDANYKYILDRSKTNFIDDEHAGLVNSVLNKTKNLNDFYSKNTYGLTKEAASKLADSTGPEASRYFRALSMGDDELLDMITTSHYNSNKTFDSLLNQDLSSLLNKYVSDPVATRRILNIKSDKTNFFGGKTTAGFFDILREEIAKEGFIQHVYDSRNGLNKKSYDSVVELFNSAGIKGADEIQAKRLADWAIFQDKTQAYSRFMIGKTDEDKIDIASSVLELFTTPDPTIAKEADDVFKESFKRNLELMQKEKVSSLEESYDSFSKTTNIIKGNDYGDYITIKKRISVLDMITDINNESKRSGFAKQFFAGRNNPEDITTGTIAPYFMLSRLSEPLSAIGLSFSNKSNQSVADLAKNIFFKRIAPVGLSIVYADYINDMVGEITGTSVTGAIANTVANIDLMSRKINDRLGITDAINNEKDINPFLSYYTGDHYMNYEERAEWYKSGYSEVRKSRWWKFGSLNEFRGSNISYYIPNYLRRIHSDWKDKSLYDSTWQKWARSPFPTPTAPFSTALYLTNPYWLEEKHKNDRPYPMSGTLFSEEAPWGPILNPTIGELIKPQRKMHKDRLDKNYIDVKSLIEKRNREHVIKAKNKNKKNIIQFKDGSISTASFTGYNAPTMSERIIRFDVSNQNISNSGFETYRDFTGGTEAKDYLSQYLEMMRSADTGGQGEVTGMGAGFTPSKQKGLSIKNKIEISAIKGNIVSDLLSQAINNNLTLGGIEQLNKATFAKASIMAQRPMEEGIINSTSIYRPGAGYLNQELSKSDLADLRGISSGDDFIGETAYAAKYLSGIYGFGLQKMFPGKHRKKLQDAGAINSPTRGFWDSNIGGLGGGSMEIIRRFIPFDNKSIDEVNPLMNNMPDWMPDRFRTGDPFTKIQKGEMRLPGRGYESINELHPDEYGDYGSFDRFKILADIAPNTPEYKVWRDIVTKNNDNPYIKEEIEQIKNRVQEQSKKYDFQYMQFLGRSLDKKMVTVDQVLDNNYFTVVGDKTKYKMAGITMSTDEETGATLKDFVIPGSNIMLAIDTNKYKSSNVDGSINAAVTVDGENINKKLLKMKLAEVRENDTSSAAMMARFNDFQIARGKMLEAIAHAPIPYFQQKFFRIREPLDSYKQEMIYGTPYASWDRPIDSFLKPAIERSLMSGTEVAVGTAVLAANKVIQNMEIGGGYKKASTAALMLTNRGAFIGGFMGMVFGGGGEVAKKSAQVGAMAQVAAYALTRSDNIVGAPLSYGGIGAYIGSKVLKEGGALKGGVIGATAGLLISAHKSSLISKDGLAPTWVPKRTKEKWEIEEYFDRLNYIKYSGLYEKAARKSLIFEGTNIKKLINIYEKDVKDRLKIRREINEYKDIVKQFYADGDERASNILTDLDNKLNSIKESELLLSAGKWATSAIAYKQAMDSTAYGLKEGASWAEIIRATPKQDREHFIEFSKEQDPEKRKEILKYVSPYHRKVLQISWGQKVDKQKSMTSFFSGHKLPKPIWSGWRPNVDMEDVKVKSIVNEGMMLSDFGYYDSSKRDNNVINAPSLTKDDYDTGIGLRTSITSTLNGLGLIGANVDVQRTQRPGIKMVANVQRIIQYNVEETFRNMTLF